MIFRSDLSDAIKTEQSEKALSTHASKHKHLVEGTWTGSQTTLSQSRPEAAVPEVKAILADFAVTNDSSTSSGRFSLGVNGAELTDSARALAKKLYGTMMITQIPLNADGSQHDVSLSGLMSDGLKQMAGKYSPERVAEVLDRLDKMSPSQLKILGHEFTDAKNSEAPLADVNRKLGILAELCKPEGIEAASNLVQRMREEGFKKVLDINQLTTKFIKHLQDNPVERKAFESFESGDLQDTYAFLEKNPNAFKTWETKSFAKQFEEFAQFTSARKQ